MTKERIIKCDKCGKNYLYKSTGNPIPVARIMKPDIVPIAEPTAHPSLLAASSTHIKLTKTESLLISNMTLE